jgi:hypothetical protein
VVSDQSLYRSGLTNTPATSDLSNMVSVDFLAGTPFYIMPNSQNNSVTPIEACKHREAYMNSSYSPTYTRYVSEGQQDWTMEFEQQQGVPFNVTLFDENSVAFSPGSWFVVDYVNFDINQTMSISWKLQEIPTFYELSLLYQLKIKVRLYH